MKTLALLFCLLASPAFAQSITVPEEVKGKVGQPIALTASKADGQVEWIVVDPGLYLTPAEFLRDSKTTFATAPAPGTYRVIAITAKADIPSRPAWINVVVEGGEPGPTPPGPKPPVPPVNLLAKKLQDAFAADSGLPSVKAAQRDLLTGLYEAMATYTATTKDATVGDLRSKLQATAEAMIMPGALIEARKVIAAEVTAAVGTEPGAVLDEARRTRAVDVFTRIAKALKEVK